MKKTLIFCIVSLFTGGVFAQSTSPVIEKAHVSVVLKQDTVVYVMDQKTKNFDKVENLLRAMPSFAITADGTIMHDSEPINNLTINGKNYPGLTMLKVMQRIPVAAVENIELIDDYGASTKHAFKNQGPEKQLNLNIRLEAINDIDYYLSNRPSRPVEGRRGPHDYPATYGDINHINEHNPLDRKVNRAIRNMLAVTDRMFEVDEYGDQIPHSMIQFKYAPQNTKSKRDTTIKTRNQKVSEQKP